MPPAAASAKVTAGFMCAPLIGPKVRISATSAPPVASALASSATARFPPARRSAMIPLPTTAASSSAVARLSATNRRPRPRLIRSLACGGSPYLEQTLYVLLQDGLAGEASDQSMELPFGEAVRLLREPVVGPGPVAPRLRHARVAQNGQLPRGVRLGEAESVLDMADAELAVAEHRDDAQPGIVSQRLEEPGGRADLQHRSSGSPHQHMHINAYHDAVKRHPAVRRAGAARARDRLRRRSAARKCTRESVPCGSCT